MKNVVSVLAAMEHEKEETTIYNTAEGRCQSLTEAAAHISAIRTLKTNPIALGEMRRELQMKGVEIS